MNSIDPLLPKRFDENEIYGITITLLIMTIVIALQKKQKIILYTECVFLWLFNLFYSSVGDYFLAMKPYDFYDTLDRDYGELMDIVLQNFAYPGLVFIFIYIYAKFKPAGIKKVLFILLSVTVGWIVETIGVKYFHLFTYKGWRSFYSFLFYIVVFTINFWIFDKVRKYTSSLN